MRVIRSTYDGVAEWQAQRRALEETRAAGTGLHVPVLEPAVVVSGPGEHAEGASVLVEVVGLGGTAVYRRLIPARGPDPSVRSRSAAYGGRDRGHDLGGLVGPGAAGAAHHTPTHHTHHTCAIRP